MAKSASRSNKAMNIPSNAQMEGMTLNQIVAQARGTDQEGSNIASNQMFERLSTNPGFINATPQQQNVMLDQLIANLPDDDAKQSVVNVINMTRPT